MTGCRNRFSPRQIQAARIRHAGGRPEEKIPRNLRKMDSKEINADQLDRLLKGKSYASIPDVLI